VERFVAPGHAGFVAAPIAPSLHLLTSPGIPLIFMGQEILEDKPWNDTPSLNTLIWCHQRREFHLKPAV
jgi:1,4-alpha-glucan branching enzyme